jgi:hypothetical protein
VIADLLEPERLVERALARLVVGQQDALPNVSIAVEDRFDQTTPETPAPPPGWTSRSCM